MKALKKVVRSLDKLLDPMKPYQLACSLGTRKGFWTLQGARNWIAYCGPVVVIGRRGKVIEWRVQGK